MHFKILKKFFIYMYIVKAMCVCNFLPNCGCRYLFQLLHLNEFTCSGLSRVLNVGADNLRSRFESDNTGTGGKFRTRSNLPGTSISWNRVSRGRISRKLWSCKSRIHWNRLNLTCTCCESKTNCWGGNRDQRTRLNYCWSLWRAQRLRSSQRNWKYDWRSLGEIGWF